MVFSPKKRENSRVHSASPDGCGDIYAHSTRTPDPILHLNLNGGGGGGSFLLSKAGRSEEEVPGHLSPRLFGMQSNPHARRKGKTPLLGSSRSCTSFPLELIQEPEVISPEKTKKMEASVSCFHLQNLAPRDTTRGNPERKEREPWTNEQKCS